LAVGADDRAALHLDERPDPRVVADPTAVEIREGVDDDVLAEVDVVDLSIRGFVDRAVSHAGRTRRSRRRRSPPAPRSFPERSGATTPRLRAAPRRGSFRSCSRGASRASRDAAAPGSARRSGYLARAGTRLARRGGPSGSRRGARRARCPRAPPAPPPPPPPPPRPHS